MNIYDFIYNQEFADACAESEHEFTDYERAYIVFKSFAPIKKKIDAYEFLIEHSEDEKLNKQLKKIIDTMNSYIEQMEEDDDIYAYAIYDGIENEWNLFDSFFDAKKWGLDKMVLKGGVSQNPTKYDFVELASFKIIKFKRCPDDVMSNGNDTLEIVYNYYGKEVQINKPLIDEKLVFENAKEKMPNIYDQFDIVRLYATDPTKGYQEFICANYPLKAKGCNYYTLTYDKEIGTFVLGESVMYDVFNLVKIDKNDADFDTMLRMEAIQNALFRAGEEAKR